VASPDLGGVKRAERFRRALAAALGREVALAVMEKHRRDGQLSGSAVVGELAGKTVLLIDDMISSGATLERAAHSCRSAGAGKLYAAATHGLLVGDAGLRLAACGIDRLALTDSVAVPRERTEPLAGRLAVLEGAPLFAAALRVIHNGGAESDFLDF
jgi:ribose-phosphate pyrophosphokinase